VIVVGVLIDQRGLLRGLAGIPIASARASAWATAGAVGEFLATVEVLAADGAYVELAAEGEGVGASADDRAVHVGVGGGGLDGIGERLGGGPGGRRVVAASGPSMRMTAWKVDSSALLVLGDLGDATGGDGATPVAAARSM
jgi:hypothetical protein